MKNAELQQLARELFDGQYLVHKNNETILPRKALLTLSLSADSRVKLGLRAFQVIWENRETRPGNRIEFNALMLYGPGGLIYNVRMEKINGHWQKIIQPLM